MSRAATSPAELSRRSTPLPARVMEVTLAFLAGVAFYVWLYGELPYHDVGRFVEQIEGDHFVWDIAHILLQPVTLVWHWYLGFGGSAESSQKHINTFATALAIAVFYATLLQLRLPLWQRVLATVLLAASCSIIILAPSGHMKLLSLPFMNGALFALVRWEQERAAGLPGGTRLVVVAGVLLGIAGGFFAGALATPPFAALALLLASRRGGESWGDGLKQGMLLGVSAGLTFAVIACLGFMIITQQPLSVEGLRASVELKASMKPEPYSLAANAARIIFATANNLIAAPVIGSIGRAYMKGFIPSLQPYWVILAEQVVPWLLTLALLAAIYLAAALAVLRGRAVLVPVAFLCGAQAWTIYYGLNDPEHWVYLTAPTVLLFLMLFPERVKGIVLPAWVGLTVAVNLAFIALPQRNFPLRANEAVLNREYGPQDLFLSFGAYPGGAYLGFFHTPDVPRLRLDIMMREGMTGPQMLAESDRRIGEVLGRGGRVIVFDVFDPYRWDAPWAELPPKGMTKARLLQHFEDGYRIVPLGELAGLQAWRLERK